MRSFDPEKPRSVWLRINSSIAVPRLFNRIASPRVYKIIIVGLGWLAFMQRIMQKKLHCFGATTHL